MFHETNSADRSVGGMSVDEAGLCIGNGVLGIFIMGYWFNWTYGLSAFSLFEGFVYTP
jgi:hypothetical protein